MKVVVFWESALWGGVESHLIELLSAWPDPEDEFTLVYNRGNQGYDRIQEKLNVLNVRSVAMTPLSYTSLTIAAQGTFFYPLLRYLLFLLRPLLFILCAVQLARFFRREGPYDLLLSNNGGYPAAWGTLSALVAGKKAGIPARLLLVHHSAVKPAPLMALFERYVDQVVMRSASAIVCVSHATRKELLKNRFIYPENVRVRVIHNGYSLKQSPQPDLPLVQRFSTLRERNQILVGIMGRIQPYKGHEDLLFAIARLTGNYRERIKAVFIGSGDDVEVKRLRNCADQLGISDHVEFLGYLEHDARDIARELDIMAMLTRSFEGFGLTLAEAMMVGTPVLATRVGAVTEFVDDSVGYLVSPSSPTEVAAALMDYVDNTESWEKRTLVARQRVEQHISSMHEEYCSLMHEVVAAEISS